MKVVLEAIGLGYSLDAAAPWVLALVTALGFVLLLLGGDWLTRGASGLAMKLEISPVVVGLIIVSAATSMPELVTTLVGVLSGSPDLGIANVVGSNVANIGLILGMAALIAPLAIHRRLMQREVPILVVLTLGFFVLARIGNGISRVDGILLLAAIVLINFALIQAARRGEIPVEEPEESGRLGFLALFLLIGVGSVALAFGAEFLVDSSVVAARRLGISEALIGLTVVAVGTSLPEVGATLAAARKRQTEIIVGNVVGSNLFNIGLIIGVVGTASPFAVSPEIFAFQFPGMVVITGYLGWTMLTGRQVSRWEGAGLLSLYGIYIALAAFLDF